MKFLRLVSALALMLGVAFAVPTSTEAADRDHGGRSNSGHRNHDSGHYARGYHSSHGHGHSYGYAPRYNRGYWGPHYAPSYAYISYGYEPYYYGYAQGPAYYAAPPVYYARPYVRPRPRINLYLGW